MEYFLREYKKSDKSQINKLALSAFEQYSSEYEDWYDDWESFKEKISQMSNLAQSAELIVAEMGSQIIGAVVYIEPHKTKSEFFNPEWTAMRMLVVFPEFRGRGVGRALTQTCIERASRDKSKILALHTSKIMEVALAMYLKMGFIFHSKAANICGVEYNIYTKKI
ncbi:MAG: GNAT family N-acetyltransferase [Methylococcaceae bacterium]